MTGSNHACETMMISLANVYTDDRMLVIIVSGQKIASVAWGIFRPRPDSWPIYIYMLTVA